MGEMTVFRGETAYFTAFVTWGTSAVAYASTAVPQGIYFVPNAISPVPAALSPVPVAIAPVPAATAGGARRFHPHCLRERPHLRPRHQRRDEVFRVGGGEVRPRALLGEACQPIGMVCQRIVKSPINALFLISPNLVIKLKFQCLRL